jgi:ABC-type branched-subunit amino acid transport system substrate-binding protein
MSLAAGMIDVRAAAAIPSSDRATRRVCDVMAPLAEVVVLAPGQPLFAAAVELMQSQAGRGVVVAGGRLVDRQRTCRACSR